MHASALATSSTHALTTVSTATVPTATVPTATSPTATVPTVTLSPDVVEQATGAITVFGETTLRIVATVVGGIVVALVLRYLIHRMTARLVRAAEPLARFGRAATGTATASLGGAVSDRRTQRADTLDSVLGSTVTVVVGVVVLVTVMQQLGWDIGPILASAGIVGVAVGFGAQSLVKDLISGVFMLLEDQYGVGDIIDIGTVSGTVESVALRITRIRDASGTLWYCRNGEILRVGNQSQGWSRAVVDVRVDPTGSPERTREVLATTAGGLAADPAFAAAVLAPPAVTFGEDMAAAGLHLQVTVKTAAGEQGSVASELRRRLRAALDDAEIPLAG